MHDEARRTGDFSAGGWGRRADAPRGTFVEGATMKVRNLSMGVAIGLMLAWGTARADVKDPLRDSLSLGGVTLYATIDVGYAYQSHGVPLSSEYLGGLEYQAFTTTRNFVGSQSTFAESGL